VDVLVIGGGPAGLMAAIATSERKARVLLCEQLPRPGAKLLVTGGGRCNLTNLADRSTFLASFGRQGRFLEPALALMDSAELRAFFAGLGVRTEAADGFHVFPTSNSARTVLSALLRRAAELGVTTALGTEVTGLILTSGRVTGVKTLAGPVQAACIILATGGKSYAELGATGTGYRLAREAGHTVVTPVPGLAPLVLASGWAQGLAGVSLFEVQVWIDLPRQRGARRRGPLLFTHRGLSGQAVLDISADVASLLARERTVPLRVNLTPDTTPQEWSARFDHWQRSQGKRLLRNLLAEHLPASLAAALCEQAGAAQVRAAEAPQAAREKLLTLLTQLPLTVVGTEGFAHSMVTRGGVSLKEVDPRTLESRKTKGLFFAGEVLDLDGPCGGYNLHWAFASGRLAGHSAVRASTSA
jgi:predicted Rossmann fold flavoprotein